jgi:hypothetical protein
MPTIILRKIIKFEIKKSIFGFEFTLKSRHAAKPETVGGHCKRTPQTRIKLK